MTEKTHYQRNDVTITSTRAVFGNKTFPLAAIASIHGREVSPNRTGPYLIVLLGAVACAFAALLSLDSIPNATKSGIVGLFFMIAGAVWASQQKPTHAVVLSTSAGEHQAFFSEDPREISWIVSAINQAIAERG